MSIENTDLEEAKIYKAWLRFNVGDSVFLKSDQRRKCPMTIALILPYDEDVDYRACWLNSQKVKEVSCFHDGVLTN